MRRSGRQPTSSGRAGWPGAERLRQPRDERGRALIDRAERANPDEVRRGEHQGQPYALPVAIIYVPAINHATQHRSQIATSLPQQAIEPPDCSGWAWNNEPG